MLIGKFTGSDGDLFFCRYCGYPHESSEYLRVRRDYSNNVCHYCLICNHKLGETDLYYVQDVSINLEESKLRIVTSQDFCDAMNAELKQIERQLRVDLLAWSCIEAGSAHKLRWRGITNGKSSSFHEIQLQLGEGLAGRVVRYQKALRIFYLDRLPEKYRHEYPIMVREELLSAMATPLIMDDVVVGCFLAGSRTSKRLSNQMLLRFEKLTRQVLSQVGEKFELKINKMSETDQSGSPSQDGYLLDVYFQKNSKGTIIPRQRKRSAGNYLSNSSKLDLG